MKVFVVNCGSSSIKYQLFDMKDESVVGKGIAEKIGLPMGIVSLKIEESGEKVEREGVAGSVDAGARSFTLAQEHGASVPVRWTDATYFGALTPATLPGQPVKVEGSFVDGVLVARKIQRGD